MSYVMPVFFILLVIYLACKFGGLFGDACDSFSKNGREGIEHFNKGFKRTLAQSFVEWSTKLDDKDKKLIYHHIDLIEYTDIYWADVVKLKEEIKILLDPRWGEGKYDFDAAYEYFSNWVKEEKAKLEAAKKSHHKRSSTNSNSEETQPAKNGEAPVLGIAAVLAKVQAEKSKNGNSTSNAQQKSPEEEEWEEYRRGRAKREQNLRDEVSKAKAAEENIPFSS